MLMQLQVIAVFGNNSAVIIGYKSFFLIVMFYAWKQASCTSVMASHAAKLSSIIWCYHGHNMTTTLDSISALVRSV